MCVVVAKILIRNECAKEWNKNRATVMNMINNEKNKYLLKNNCNL